MRTNEERIASMHARAEEMERKQRMSRVRLMQTLASVTSFAAVILLAVFMPKVASFGKDPASVLQGGMQASILGDSGALAYVVIAVIAFLLGVFVTAFCFSLKRWQDENNQDSEL